MKVKKGDFVKTWMGDFGTVTQIIDDPELKPVIVEVQTATGVKTYYFHWDQVSKMPKPDKVIFVNSEKDIPFKNVLYRVAKAKIESNGYYTCTIGENKTLLVGAK